MLLLAPLLLAFSILPQDSSTPPRERWVIRLAGGPLHRGLAREVPEGFELLRDGRWERVARADVLHAARESNLLADLDARRARAATRLDQRVEVARWALAEGLLPESIAEIDGVLEADPDFAAARDLITFAPLALTLPGGAGRSLPERLVLFGARAKPAYRELAAARLASLASEDAQPVLVRALQSRSTSVRAFAAFAARRIDPKLFVDALVRRAVLDPSRPVRVEAARALRDARDEILACRVAAALDLEDARPREFAAEALGEMGYRSAIPALAARLAALSGVSHPSAVSPASHPASQSGSHPGGTRAHIRVGSQVAYVQDFNVEIAQGASIGDPIVGVVEDATVLDVRVGGTSTQSVELEGPTLCRALARLSGEKLPEKPAVWLEWWKQNAARFAERSPTRATGD
jgi:hypothetical protein